MVKHDQRSIVELDNRDMMEQKQKQKQIYIVCKDESVWFDPETGGPYVFQYI